MQYNNGTVAAVSLGFVTCVTLAYLFYSKWKSKTGDPPDKTQVSGRQKKDKTSNALPSQKPKAVKPDVEVVAQQCTEAKHKGKECCEGSKVTLKQKAGAGDHLVEEEAIVEEGVNIVEVKPTESIPSAAHTGFVQEVKPLVARPEDKAVTAETISSNETNLVNEEKITSSISCEVNASPKTSSLPAREQATEVEYLPVTEQIIVNNVVNTESGKPLTEVKTASNESKAVVQNTSNNADLVGGLCDKVRTGEPEESLSQSWHEDVDEQCDTPVKHSNTRQGTRVAGSSDSNKSPISDVMTNGVSSGSDEERLTRSPAKTDNKKAEDSHTGSDASSNCDNLSEASNDSGKGGSVTENSQQSGNDEERIYEFNIPSNMCGMFIGTRGKTIKTIRDQSGARIRLRNNPYTPEFQICVIEGPQSTIDRALATIKRKFPSLKYPGMDLAPLASAPVIMPDIMQLGLPEGVSVDIVVSSIVDAGRVFVQQPTHPTFPSLERLNAFMNQCYLQDGAVPDIPRPIESGVICAAPMLNGWYRAQIMAYYEQTDECDIKYVDYGGYSHISSQCLKQIRSDFMTLPFEAIECYLGNITPIESESYFSPEAAAVLEELTMGKLLQAQVVGRAEDGIPYVHIYQLNGTSPALLVNRELVNRGVARWIELVS